MDEAKELIRIHQHREAHLDAGVTVRDMAETLGLPDAEVQEMLNGLRARKRIVAQPIFTPGHRRNHRLLPTVAMMAVLLTTAFVVILVSAVNPFGREDSTTYPSYAGENLYAHDAVLAGKRLGITAPAGFSYEIRIDADDVATLGSIKHFIPMADITPENSHVFQEELTNDVIDALNKMVAQSPPKWVNGEAVAEALSNYYLGGDPVPSTYTVRKSQFPYKPSSPEGKALHDSVLNSIKENWEKITEPHYRKPDDVSTHF